MHTLRMNWLLNLNSGTERMSTFWLMNMLFVTELSVRRVCLTSERVRRVVIL